MKIIDFIKRFFTKKQIENIKANADFTDIQKNIIDKEWSILKNMSGYGISIILNNSQNDNLAVAMVHSEPYIITRLTENMLESSKENFNKLMEKYKNTTENDGYKMKSHIINTHQDCFNKVKLRKVN